MAPQPVITIAVGIFAIMVGTVLFASLRRLDDWVSPMQSRFSRRLTLWVMNDPRRQRMVRGLYVACGTAIITRGILEIAGIL